MALEHCLVLIKPDGVELSLTGEVITHLDRDDLIIIGTKAVEVSRELAASHYYEHRNKPFYNDVIKYLMGRYHSFHWVYAFAFCGEKACEKIRAIMGKTNPLDIQHEGKTDTLRQKYGRNVIIQDCEGKDLIDENGHAVVRYENVTHASFCDSAEYEIKLWFSPEELLSKYRLYPVVQNESHALAWEKPASEIKGELFK